jgi:hypothetical protein
MARARKKRIRKKKTQQSQTRLGLAQLATGMPALDNVKKVVDFVSPQKVKYKILETTEMDAYDPLPAPPKRRGKRKPG